MHFKIKYNEKGSFSAYGDGTLPFDANDEKAINAALVEGCLSNPIYAFICELVSVFDLALTKHAKPLQGSLEIKVKGEISYLDHVCINLAALRIEDRAKRKTGVRYLFKDGSDLVSNLADESSQSLEDG